MRANIFPNKIRRTLPRLGAQEGIRDLVVHMKFLTRDTQWAWYVTEGSPENDDFIFFGFVIGFEEEWGNFSLSELTELRGPSGFPIERDLQFEPASLSRIMARENRSNTAGRMGGNFHTNGT